jgi:hypothetical protein
MPDFIIPTSATIELIAQDKMPALMQNRPIFQIFPVRTKDESMLIWEQKDNYTGLQAVRGMNGAASRVKKTGGKRYSMRPGHYGEFEPLDEEEMERRRPYGTFGQAIDLTDLVMDAQDKLLQRRLDRIELIGWTLLGQGIFSVLTPQGTVIHTDTFPIQTFTANPLWTNPTTSHPLADFRQMRTLHRGHSVAFDASSTVYANQTTVNTMLANTNANDLGGRRSTGLETINNLQDLNRLLTRDNLPAIVEYDEGYIDDSNTFQLFIQNYTLIVTGKRPAGQVLGEYRMTRNVNNVNLAPGPYMKVIDKGEVQVPREIEIHDGHNGGPVIFYPSGVVTMTVG